MQKNKELSILLNNKIYKGDNGSSEFIQDITDMTNSINLTSSIYHYLDKKYDFMVASHYIDDLLLIYNKFEMRLDENSLLQHTRKQNEKENRFKENQN